MLTLRYVQPPRFGFCLCLTGLLAGASYAQARTYSVDCNYTVNAAANISATHPIPERRVTADIHTGEKFSMTFIVESNAKTGYMKGKLGASRVTVVWGAEKFTFVEVTGDGTVQVTTVYGMETGRTGFGPLTC